MIEKAILDYLNEVLTIPAYMEMPEEPPDRYVIIQKTGSGKGNHICSVTFAIQSYAESLYMAAETNEEVKEAMDDIITLDDICKVELNTDYEYSDIEKKQYRYQAIYDLTHY